MPEETYSRYAGVIAHQDMVVLVREEYPGWGGAFWNIPSGRIEDHESPEEGASRELIEETGLAVPVADLVLHGTSSVVSRGQVGRAWNFTVDVADPALRLDDPDGLIQDAGWFPVTEAARLLGELPYRPLSEPSVAILTHRARPGTHWAYPDPAAEPVITVQGD